MHAVASILTLALVLGDDAAKSKPTIAPELSAKAGAAEDRAIEFLRKSQNEDGSFAKAEIAPSVTALVVAGVLRTHRVGVRDPMIEKALQFVEKHIKPDGGVYISDVNKNYPTAIAIMAFAEANKDGRYQSVIDKAVAVLKSEQWGESKGVDPSHMKWGGAGYGAKTRPDLSNTTFLIDALNAAGVPKSDPAYQRAIQFVTRCQNLSGEGANDLPLGSKINDGGFYYTPTDPTNPGGGDPQTGFRSYGSMTYAGLKSFIHAGVDKNDPRVQGAIRWIKKHYTLAENPGMGEQGYYYYVQTFAKALDVLDIDQFEDADGKKHDWRADLIDAVVARQKPDGSWVNTAPRWLESDPNLVTAYGLLALAYATE